MSYHQVTRISRGSSLSFLEVDVLPPGDHCKQGLFPVFSSGGYMSYHYVTRAATKEEELRSVA